MRTFVGQLDSLCAYSSLAHSFDLKDNQLSEQQLAPLKACESLRAQLTSKDALTLGEVIASGDLLLLGGGDSNAATSGRTALSRADFASGRLARLSARSRQLDEFESIGGCSDQRQIDALVEEAALES